MQWLLYIAKLGIETKETGKNDRRDPGSNQGPLDLQSNALPTELSRLTLVQTQAAYRVLGFMPTWQIKKYFPDRESNPGRRGENAES